MPFFEPDPPSVSAVEINDSSVANSTTYSSSRIEQRLSAVASSAVTSFVGLSDTPATLSAGQAVRANASATALEFYTPSSGIMISDASVSSSSVYSSQKIDSTYLQQNKVKNATSTTAGDVYDAPYLNTQLANKANASHTHPISEITNLQTSLDAKLETSKVKNTSSSTAGDVYDAPYLNTELAGKASASHTHPISEITNLQTSLDAKMDKTSIQTTAEGDSTSETDVYSCNSVYSKNQINTSVTSQEVTVNNQTTTGRLNFGSNLTSGLYGSIQSYANSTRYSAMHHYATGGNCNLDWYLMRNNSLTKTLQIFPNGNENVFECLTGGIKAPIFQQRDNTTVIKIGRMDSTSYGIPGIAIIPLLNTVNSEIQMRGLRNTGILGDSYVYHQNGSTLTIQSRIATNRHSATHSNIEVSTYQNGAEEKVLEIGSNGSSKTLTITGTTHGTGYFTTDETTFNNAQQLVSKNYVDTRLPTDVDTPISYTIQNAVTDQNYLFGVNGSANAMALVEIPKVYTGVPASSRSVRVGFNGGDYGSGMVALGYEALADGTGSAGQTNAVRSVAVGYQAGFQSQGANHGIYIGPYQGYQLSTSNQLRIGNSGVSPTTTGYDKAIIEGTMATTDAGQTLRLNADTIYLGSSLPTSQPADNRLWLSNGNLSIGAVSGGGGGGSSGLTQTITLPITSGNTINVGAPVYWNYASQVLAKAPTSVSDITSFRYVGVCEQVSGGNATVATGGFVTVSRVYESIPLTIGLEVYLPSVATEYAKTSAGQQVVNKGTIAIGQVVDFTNQATGSVLLKLYHQPIIYATEQDNGTAAQQAYKFDFLGSTALSNNQTLTSTAVGGNTLSAVVEGTGHATHTFNGFTTPEFTNYDTSVIITIPASMVLSSAGQVIHIYWVLKERDPDHGLHFNFSCYNNQYKTTRYKTFGNYSLNNGKYLIEPGSIEIDPGPYRSNDIIIYDVKLRQGANACEVTMHAYNGTAWSNNSAVNFDHQYMNTFDRIATSHEAVFGGHGARMCPCEMHISATLMTTADLNALKTKWQGFAQ